MPEILEIESPENDEDDIHHFAKLFLDLVGATEEVSIILRKTTHTSQTVQLTTLFVYRYTVPNSARRTGKSR